MMIKKLNLDNFIVKLDKLKLLFFKYNTKVNTKVNVKVNTNTIILYNVHNSFPETSNGYATRTHTIAKSVQNKNIEISVVTRPGFPFDLIGTDKSINNDLFYLVDDIKYYRILKNAYGLWDVSISRYLNRYVELLTKFALTNKSTIIHSSSNYINGLAGISTAYILNIPSIYEVRGFWEITKASRERSFKNSLGFRLQKKLEIQACNEATNIIALSEIVKEELIKRGILEDKIFVVPNGVDTDNLVYIKKDKNLINKLKLKDKFVVGFIGSVVDYEGLKLLVYASQIIENRYFNIFRYLIVGDGNDIDNLRNLVKKLEVDHLFLFEGRVSYSEVKGYYSVSDIFCYPRLNWEVCQIVSPKKPFEAMAYGKPIISSSVRANSYFIKNEINGLIHEQENVNSLVDNILKLYEDKELYSKISKNARKWVVENRDIKITGKLLKEIYSETKKKFYEKNQK